MISDCCSALVEYHDICSSCGEHCSPYEEECYDCNSQGWFWSTDKDNKPQVQRCDTCRYFQCDKDVWKEIHLGTIMHEYVQQVLNKENK